MTSKTTSPIGADALLQTLKQSGIPRIFAYPGGAILPIYDRLPQYDIERILVRHEQGAGFAAQGVSRASDQVGVCLATSGPGATNLVTAIADARLDSVPMVAITGNVFTHLIGSDAFQEVDIIGICDPIVKHSFFITKADDIPAAVQEALFLARSGRPGPVLVDITKTAQTEPLSPEIWEALQQPAHQFFNPHRGTAPSEDLSQLPKVVETFKTSQRPLAILGHGVWWSGAQQAVQKCLEAANIPFVWTVHGIGALPSDHPQSLGMLGMHGTATANYATHHADLIFGIGIRFDDRITAKLETFCENKKFVHMDIDPSEFNKNVPAIPLQGDLKSTIPQLTDALPAGDFAAWWKALQQKQKDWPLPAINKQKLTETRVLQAIFDQLDDQAAVVVDVGQHQMWAAQRFPGKSNQRFINSGGLGSMGFSLPTAMGAVYSGRETWSISGDGGFQMNLQELATIAQEQLPLKIVILNNSFLGMVRQWQELFYQKNYVDTPLYNPDFVAVAKAYGIEGLLVDQPEQLSEAVEKLKQASGSILVEFKVEKEENVFPMVPAGDSLGRTLLDRKKRIDE